MSHRFKVCAQTSLVCPNSCPSLLSGRDEEESSDQQLPVHKTRCPSGMLAIGSAALSHVSSFSS